jgi:hypothetical protein
MFNTNRIAYVSGLALGIVLTAGSASAQDSKTESATPPPLQAFPLTDTSALNLQGVKADVAQYRGRTAVRLTNDSEDRAGLAWVKDTDFRDGTIEFDVATHILAPPGVRMPGFTGIALRARQQDQHFELFYLRPGNALSDDQAMRNHSVQYTSEPSFGWERLRRQWPMIYEAYADIHPDDWIKVKIEVHGRLAKLYVNGSANPSLVVDGMKGEELRGPIALWGYTGEESYFSNLRITNDKPEAIENGGDAAGTWDLVFNTDAGRFGGTMKLVRQGNTLVGLWSGALGADQPVNGFWRDGYIEVSFSGTWPDQPGAVTATMVGWVDGDAAKGRVKVEGRADGRWTATRSK